MGSCPNAPRSFLRSDEMCTRVALLKLLTLLSHTCSISSSWLTGRPWLSIRYSKMPVSLRVRDKASSPTEATRALVSKLSDPQVRTTSLCVKRLSVRLRIRAASSSRWNGLVR